MTEKQHASIHDLKREPVFAEREADWRNGPVVYQLIVDRFAPAADMDAKRDLYPAPKRLRDWSENPTAGTYNEDVQVWSHEIDFWGGDLQSLRGKLDYFVDLGVDVVYLNPIHLAYTNHKYDAQNYFEISPEYGTREDFKELAADIHDKGMKVVLDGVFNHMGRTSPWFQEALANPDSPWREWYFIGPQYRMGYRGWYSVANLPEVHLESPTVRARLWGDPDSVVQGFLRDGADGWRLDVAFDIGPVALQDLTTNAHKAKPGSLVLGEIYNYPDEWFPAMDAGLNMTFHKMIMGVIKGELHAPLFSRMTEQMVADTGLEPLLKSWVVLDNHDRKRLRTELPQRWQQKMAQVLQFTLPGSPCIYYGVELGLEGGDDPQQRGPMRWETANEQNEYFAWMKQLIAMRNNSRGLRIGDYLHIESRGTIAFLRRTERVAESVLVVANPTDKPVQEFLLMREAKFMDNHRLKCMLTGAEVTISAGTATFTIPAQTAWVLSPIIPADKVEYNTYGRVH